MYMSACLLRFPRKPNELSDDLESFVHVATIMGLRFHLHDKSPADEAKANPKLVLHVDATYFEEDATKEGYSIGGGMKFDQFCNGSPGVKFDYDNLPLPTLITELYALFRPYYKTLDINEYQAKYGTVTRIRKAIPGGTTLESIRRETLVPMTSSNSFSATPTSLSPPKESPHYFKDIRHQDLVAVFQRLYTARDWPTPQEKTVDQFRHLKFQNDTLFSSKHSLDVSESSNNKRQRKSGPSTAEVLPMKLGQSQAQRASSSRGQSSLSTSSRTRAKGQRSSRSGDHGATPTSTDSAHGPTPLHGGDGVFDTSDILVDDLGVPSTLR